ncbi:Protein of unknown function [Gryllus bimaculatus]|nr:Protein of unknown function [Gryllus bimaculatus]
MVNWKSNPVPGLVATQSKVYGAASEEAWLEGGREEGRGEGQGRRRRPASIRRSPIKNSRALPRCSVLPLSSPREHSRPAAYSAFEMMKILLVLVAALALVAAAPAASPYPSVLAPLVYGVSPPEAYAAAAYGPSVVYRPSVMVIPSITDAPTTKKAKMTNTTFSLMIL